MSHDPIRFRLMIHLMILLAVLLLGTLGFVYLENRTPLDAFYFIIVTLASVGYGDIHPTTPGAKVFVIFLIILGVGTFVGVLANGTEMILSRREN